MAIDSDRLETRVERGQRPRRGCPSEAVAHTATDATLGMPRGAGRGIGFASRPAPGHRPRGSRCTSASSKTPPRRVERACRRDRRAAREASSSRSCAPARDAVVGSRAGQRRAVRRGRPLSCTCSPPRRDRFRDEAASPSSPRPSSTRAQFEPIPCGDLSRSTREGTRGRARPRDRELA